MNHQPILFLKKTTVIGNVETVDLSVNILHKIPTSGCG